MDYVFLCIDDNQIRNECINFLIDNEISFIDVGLGVNIIDDNLIGSIRTTSGSNKKYDHIEKRIPKSLNNFNEYLTNIQIVELNALNATLAVIKWKKSSGFYQDLELENHSTYSINNSQLLNEQHN